VIDACLLAVLRACVPLRTDFGARRAAAIRSIRSTAARLSRAQLLECVQKARCERDEIARRKPLDPRKLAEAETVIVAVEDLAAMASK
jgi:hypothetical protein